MNDAQIKSRLQAQADKESWAKSQPKCAKQETNSGLAQQVEIAEFLTIGRDPNNHIVLNDAFTSLRHTRVERKLNGFLLRVAREGKGDKQQKA